MSEQPAPVSSEIPALDVAALGAACDRAISWPLPGRGQTARRFDLLRGTAENDLVLGRLVEAHADALAIISELSGPPGGAGQRWGVWAAGPADSVQACRSTRTGWHLEGIKAWCSGASLVTHALVDASTVAGQQLFAVDLADPGIAIGSPAWVGPGMVRADTRSVRFHQASGLAVGQPGQYLTRPGFWAGAIGVAACWHGGTIAVARPLLERSRHRLEPHLLAHLGSVHVHLEQNRAILASAARQVDEHFCRDHQLLAGAVRTTVERNAVAVVDRAAERLDPPPSLTTPNTPPSSLT